MNLVQMENVRGETKWCVELRLSTFVSLAINMVEPGVVIEIIDALDRTLHSL